MFLKWPKKSYKNVGKMIFGKKQIGPQQGLKRIRAGGEMLSKT